jgi:hypothetical protein
MLSRENFVFTIGYDGPTAVVDGRAKRRYGRLSAKELAEKGLFRAAYSAAVWSKDRKDMEDVIEAYNRASGASLSADSVQGRLFGVFPIEVGRAVVL